MTIGRAVSHYLPIIRIIVLMWLIWAFEYATSIDLSYLGIYPGEVTNLVGILFAPLLHGDLGHIISNTIPLFVLGLVLYTFYPNIANWVLVSCYFFTGLLVWLFARESLHIGASGLVYSLAGFLISYGLFKKDFKSLLISIIIVTMYGGMIYGIFPTNERVSWESHLFGVLTGIGTALSFSRSKAA